MTLRGVAPKVLRGLRETTQHTLGRNDLRPGQSHYVAGLVSVRHFPVFREPRWRRKVHVKTYVSGVYLTHGSAGMRLSKSWDGEFRDALQPC